MDDRVFKPIAVIEHFHDVAVIGQPIEQGRRHLLVNEHRRPLREAEVGGNDDAGALAQLADQMEQQGATHLSPRPGFRKHGLYETLLLVTLITFPSMALITALLEPTRTS